LGASFRLPYRSCSRSISVATEILILHFVVQEAAGNDGAPLPAAPRAAMRSGRPFMSASPSCPKVKYGSLRGGSDCLSGELGGIWFSGVAGRGLSVIFFLRCGAELSQAGPGVKPSRSPRSIICRIAVSRISTSVVYVDLRSPFGGWSYVRIVILWGPSAHVSGPVRLVWRRWPSSPIV
jgi:hypothetical protein